MATKFDCYHIYSNGCYYGVELNYCDACSRVSELAHSVCIDGRYLQCKECGTAETKFKNFIGEDVTAWVIIYQYESLQYNTFIIIGEKRK